MIQGLVSWLEATDVAIAIRQSILLTGLLSGLHLVGMTLIGGGALVSGMRVLGSALAEYPVSDVTRTARRAMAAGVLVSVVSGGLLFAPRASTAIASGYFQLKMLLLAAALIFQFSIVRAVTERRTLREGVSRLAGGVNVVLWFAVILAGCAYILLEG